MCYKNTLDSDVLGTLLIQMCYRNPLDSDVLQEPSWFRCGTRTLLIQMYYKNPLDSDVLQERSWFRCGTRTLLIQMCYKNPLDSDVLQEPSWFRCITRTLLKQMCYRNPLDSDVVQEPSWFKCVTGTLLIQMCWKNPLDSDVLQEPSWLRCVTGTLQRNSLDTDLSTHKNPWNLAVSIITGMTQWYVSDQNEPYSEFTQEISQKTKIWEWNASPFRWQTTSPAAFDRNGPPICFPQTSPTVSVHTTFCSALTFESVTHIWRDTSLVWHMFVVTHI